MRRSTAPIAALARAGQISGLVGASAAHPTARQACAEFLQAIPNDMLDELRTYCGNADNFRHPEEGDEEDAEALAGN
jgi:hypothetical protein